MIAVSPVSIVAVVIALIIFSFGVLFRHLDEKRGPAHINNTKYFLRKFLFHGWWVIALLTSIDHFVIPSLNDIAMIILIAFSFVSLLYLGYFFYGWAKLIHQKTSVS